MTLRLREEQIVVVDDDRMQRTMMVRMLESQGFQVTSASGGQEALKLLDGQRFQLAVLDFDMPDMDGIEVFQALRRQQARISGLMVTSCESPQTVLSARTAGFSHVLFKPVSVQALSTAVDLCLKCAALNSSPRAWQQAAETGAFPMSGASCHTGR